MAGDFLSCVVAWDWGCGKKAGGRCEQWWGESVSCIYPGAEIVLILLYTFMITNIFNF